MAGELEDGLGAAIGPADLDNSTTIKATEIGRAVDHFVGAHAYDASLLFSSRSSCGSIGWSSTT